MLENGEVFADDYRVVRRLGEGGFGAVYEALQLSTGRRRALKVMHHDLRLDGELRERFVREARIGAEIESEHVVEVVGAGVTRDGVPWLAMELLEGWTLTEAVGHGPLAPSMLLDVLAQLCHGLDAAHRAGVVHRDLKPDNVFLARPRGASPDAALRVKLLDFGIARCAEGSQTGRNSQVLGSPRWMAPEQLVVGARLGPEADVWAFALLVFFCWTGRSYWLAGQVGASNVAALLLEIHGGPVEAPSSRAATLGAAAAWPRALDRWFLRCVARDPAARFASIDDAFDDLRRALGPLGDASADGGAAPTEELAIPSTAAPPADPGVATVPPGARVARPRSLESTLLPTRAGPRPPTPAAAAATAAATRAASAPSRRRATIVLATIGAVLVVGALGAVVVVATTSRRGEGASVGPTAGTATPRAPAPVALDAAPEVPTLAATLARDCTAGRARACVTLGQMHEDGNGVERDDARAAALYRDACARGDGLGCAFLGAMQEAGRGGLAIDLVQAVASYRRACDLGEGSGCSDLGVAYERGAGGLAVDDRTAVAFFRRACDAGASIGCANLGMMLRDGRGGLAADVPRAGELFERSCRDGAAVGCAELARLHETGTPTIPRDHARAAELYRRACDDGVAGSCNDLAVLCFEGSAGSGCGPRDAAPLWRRACDDGVALACSNLGGLYEEGTGGLVVDEAAAVTLYRRACDADDPQGCRRLAAMYTGGRGGLPRDAARATELLRRACDAGDQEACRAP